MHKRDHLHFLRGFLLLNSPSYQDHPLSRQIFRALNGQEKHPEMLGKQEECVRVLLFICYQSSVNLLELVIPVTRKNIQKQFYNIAVRSEIFAFFRICDYYLLLMSSFTFTNSSSRNC